MGIFTGRNNIHAWGYALFGEENEHVARSDEMLYAQLTEQQIANDCRIILESAEICATTKSRDTRVSRSKVATERFNHLNTLVPFADNKQKVLIKQASKAMKTIWDIK